VQPISWSQHLTQLQTQHLHLNSELKKNIRWSRMSPNTDPLTYSQLPSGLWTHQLPQHGSNPRWPRIPVYGNYCYDSILLLLSYSIRRWTFTIYSLTTSFVWTMLLHCSLFWSNNRTMHLHCSLLFINQRLDRTMVYHCSLIWNYSLSSQVYKLW